MRLATRAGVATLGVAGVFLHSAAWPAFAQPIAYVTNNTQIGVVSAIDTRTNTLVTNVSLGETHFGASGIAASPDGKEVYVLQDSVLATIDTASNAVTGVIAVTGSSVAFRPDGARAYVAGCGSSAVCVIDVKGRAITAVIAVGGAPWGVAVSGDGARAYVSNCAENSLCVIDLVAQRVTNSVPVDGFPGPVAVASGSVIYVGTSDQDIDSFDTVAVIDTSAQEVVATVTVGGSPAGIAFTPDGRFAYVANHFAPVWRPEPFHSVESTVSVVDTSTHTVTDTIFLGDITEPLGIAITPDGTRAYVAELEGGVAVIDTTLREVVARLVVADGPNFVAIADVPRAVSPTVSVPPPMSRNSGGCTLVDPPSEQQAHVWPMLLAGLVLLSARQRG